MGGEIWLNSELEKGTTFAFTIQAERGEKKQDSLPTGSVDWDNMRVLAVDSIRECFCADHSLETQEIHAAKMTVLRAAASY